MSASTGPAGGLTPAAIARAYGVDPTARTTQVVGVVAAFHNPNLVQDLNAFDARYGLPPEAGNSVSEYSQRGGRDLPVSRADWAGEQTLDVQAVRGLCHTCRIIVVEADSDADSDIAAAVNQAVALGATVVSNSYGEPEPAHLDPALVAAYRHPGVVVVAGAGDDGMFSWDRSNSGDPSADAPMWPASLATVVAVGGTSLTVDASGTRTDEVVWNSNGEDDLAGLLGVPLGATGGGCSTQIPAQAWQRAVAGWSQTGCGTTRLSADVAAVGDPWTGFDVYNTFESSGWQTVGGTSLSTPLIAAMWALAGGAGGVPYPALSLYGHLKTDPGSTVFDVVRGGNGYCGGDTPSGCTIYIGQSPNTLGLGVLDCAFKPASEALTGKTRACNAAVGYDGPSGVGSPLTQKVFAPLSPSATLVGPTSAVRGVTTSFSATAVKDPFPGGTMTTVAWKWGDGSLSYGKTVTHAWSKPGTYSVRLTLIDNYGVRTEITRRVVVT